MGLCKCPKKKVTNQYCFEHRVNVCEHCMVTEHPKCVVQSYLRWLDDSDYNPVCQLCQEDLVSDECVRLVCYDVFHKVCLDEWAQKLPRNTAPAGYRCPVCSSPIFPAPNLVSPVADVLRNVLTTFDWARTGLGLPLVKSENTIMNNAEGKLIGTHQNTTQFDRGIPDGQDPVISSTSVDEYRSNMKASQHRNAAAVASGISRKHSNSSTILINNSDEDDKYKRRPALEWFNRWLRTFHNPSSRHHQGFFGGRRRMGLILTVLTVLTIVIVLSYNSRRMSNEDPMLDPFNNPNIRIEDE